MAMKLVNATKLDEDLTNLADLLREKTGTTADLTFPNDFVTQINKTYTADDFTTQNFSGTIYLPTATSIAAYAFTNSNITEIHAPNVTEIRSTSIESSYTGKGTFYNCTQLTIIDLPKWTILGGGGYQFANCTSLTQVILPSQAAGQHMFDGCTSLQIARLGKNSNFNSYCFNGCASLIGVDIKPTRLQTYEFNGATNITTIIIRSLSVPTLDNINAFNGSPFASGKAGGTLYVPENLIDTYKTATNWSTILSYTTNTILPIEESIYATQYIDGELIGG